MKFIEQWIWSQSSTSNPSYSSGVDTSLLNGLSGSKSIAPDQWVAGASYRISGFGQCKVAVGFPTPTLKLKIGSTVIASAALAVATASVDIGWMFDGQIQYHGSGDFTGIGLWHAARNTTEYNQSMMVPAGAPVNIASLSSPLDMDLVVNLVTSEWTYFKMYGGRCVRVSL